MTGTLLVTPSKLQSAAKSFSSSASSVQSQTNQMMNIVQSACRSWQGDASRTYLRKFMTLQDDMIRMFKHIHEHSTDLDEMAAHYMEAERAIESSVSGFKENVIH